MRKALVGSLLTAALLAPIPAPATGLERVPEACLAVNPGIPTCTFTVAQNSAAPTPTGVSAVGDWIVVVKRGKKKITMKSTGAIPDGPEFTFKIGDVVTARAKSPGTYVLVGHSS